MSLMLWQRPEEQREIGKILTSYGDIEYQLSQCVGAVTDDDNTAVRCLFRLRGGNLRIQIADALIRPAYKAVGLKDQYETALGAARYSTKIRNQYAHCHFISFEKAGLYFTDLEKAASTSEGDLRYSAQHIDLPLLKLQSAYVIYSFDWFYHLQGEYRLRAGKISIHNAEAPKIIDKPPLHNPIEEHPLPRPMTEGETPIQAAPREVR